MDSQLPTQATVGEENTTPVILAPLIALGCALGVFLIVLVIIVLDSECRKRKHKAKCKTIAAANVAVEKPEITNWRDIEVGSPIRTPVSASRFHEDTIIEEDEMDMREPEPADFDPTGSADQVGATADAQQALGDLLVNRLEEVEGVEENESHVCESPLDYGYEGEDGSESAGPNG